MKFRKRVIAAIMTFVMALNFIFVVAPTAFAHETILEVDYDDCTPDEDGDGIDEMWYSLHDTLSYYHFPHDIDTITYRFMGDPAEWVPEGMSPEFGEEFKVIYANSMEKWNNVYFYSHNPDGTITKNKLINVVEITEETPNIAIYPINSDFSDEEGAKTRAKNLELIEDGNPRHEHITSWTMEVNIETFFEDTYLSNILHLTSDDIDLIRECTGAHELGHVLGLRDIENYCNADDATGLHHHEVLLGYGTPVCARSAGITYKDIAGVAITRGFHTDNDHQWLSSWDQTAQKYKLICSICNGVKYVSSLDGYSHNTYGCCEDDHDLTDGNMMAVASYGDQDYYKCKYCRYVAPFSEIVDQNYEITPYSNDYHKCENTVAGLEYSFYEAHSYDTCISLNSSSHQRVCACGATGGTQRHYVTGGNGINRYVPCAGCGYLLDMRDNIYEGIMSITQVSVNGSYIRSDGIVVLVDEDIEAYLAGTLQFYHPEDVPVTQ